MADELRYIEPGVVYELVRRTENGRFAFKPSPELNREIAGMLKAAKRRWPEVKLHQTNWPSNHTHTMFSVTDPMAANRFTEWLNYVMAESAKIAQAINGVEGRIWESKRCRLIPILDDEMLRERTKYIMGQAVNAGLVAKPTDWPGLNTCKALCEGQPLIGYRGTAALRRQARREKLPMVTIAARQVLHLDPLPSQADWQPHERRSWYRRIAKEIVEENAAKHPGRRYRTPAYFTTLDPNTTTRLVDSPAPKCWASPTNEEKRRDWRRRFRAFTAAWREALQAWIEGAKPCFPPGGWVPFKACYSPSYTQRV